MDLERFGWRMIELLPQLIREISRRESNYLSQGKITLPQLWVLEALSRQGSSPMNKIAQSLGVSRPAATGLIDRLIAQGLVRRQPDTRDRRIVRAALTAKGSRIVKNIWEQKRKTLMAVFGRISPSGRGQYLNILEKVVQTLREN